METPLNRPLILVTGATDGIGLRTATLLAHGGADVIVHGRTAHKAQAAADTIAAEVGRALPAPVFADLASLAAVRAMADAVLARDVPLDVLVNNAGVFMHGRVLTADGLETTMAVNHFAPFVLTHRLLPALARAAQGRVVNVSSTAHQRGRLDVADLTFTRTFDGYLVYASSKLANVLFTKALAPRVAAAGAGRVTVNALHPGVVGTKLLKSGFGAQGSDSLDDGAATSVLLATAPELGAVTGHYFVARKPARVSAAADDKGMARAFYDVSARLTQTPPLPA